MGVWLLNAVTRCLVAPPRQSGVASVKVISCDWPHRSVSGILPLASYLKTETYFARFAVPAGLA
ncbi:hypothetical protein D1820_00190 [Phaeobacter sp. LSS9]|nr:hypothetical protein D1820_00190 [Phaeobacter sp. LSS9]